MVVMDSLNKEEKNYLLKLAVQAIKDGLQSKYRLPTKSSLPFSSLKEKKACFVSLHCGEQLRGCVGHIEATQPLYKDVYENAQAAAFADPRFLPLENRELPYVQIEISLLSQPEELRGEKIDDRLKQIKPGIHGVIIDCFGRRATFLPQVWQDLPKKQDFLKHLCRKAFLPENTWSDPKAKISIYTIEKIAS